MPKLSYKMLLSDLPWRKSAKPKAKKVLIDAEDIAKVTKIRRQMSYFPLSESGQSKFLDKPKIEFHYDPNVTEYEYVATRSMTINEVTLVVGDMKIPIPLTHDVSLMNG